MTTKAEEAFQGLSVYDGQFRDAGSRLGGIDEVGRGSLAGPLVVACVVLNPPRIHNLVGVYDSKAISAKRREKLADLIHNTATSVGFGLVLPQEIDRIGMAGALRKAVCDAMMVARPDFVMMDGVPISMPTISFSGVGSHFVVKGDQKSLSIAAASIVAKVYRDNLMIDYADQYPEYGFDSNKGYGGAKHIDAIKEHGPCPIHRYSFAPVKGNWERHL